MSFNARVFTFDGIPSENYGVEIIRFDISDVRTAAPCAVKPRLSRSAGAFRYGIYGGVSPENLTLRFTLGVGEVKRGWEYRGNTVFLNRFEVDAISKWLTDSPTRWKWLEISQPDLDGLRFRCVISSLTRVDAANYPIAFEAEAVCDSAYAYAFPVTREIACGGYIETEIINERSAVERYFPILEISPMGAGNITIENVTAGAAFRLTGLPITSGVIYTFDGENGTAVCASPGVPNVYRYFNFEFLPLLRGLNALRISGACNVRFICSYPVNAGG